MTTEEILTIAQGLSRKAITAFAEDHGIDLPEPVLRELTDLYAFLLVARHNYASRGADLEAVDERARSIWTGAINGRAGWSTEFKLHLADSERQVIA